MAKKKTNTDIKRHQTLFNYPNHYPTARNFADGGFFKGIGNNIGGIASGVGALFGNFKQQSEIADTSGIESNIQQVKNTQIGGNNDELMDMYNTFSSLDKVNAADLRQGNAVGGALSGIASGAGAGMSFGPVGAAIGGVVGGLTSIFGSHQANKKAKKKARELNQQIDEAEAYRDLNFANAVANADKLSDQTLMANYVAYGGHISNGTQFKDDLTFFNEGGTHNENPIGGVMIGMDPQGIPNMVEEGEVRWKDYIFSNRLKPTEKDLELLNMDKKWKNKSFAELAKSLNKESDERPNDPISKNGKEDVYSKLQALQELQKQSMFKNNASQVNMFNTGGTAENIKVETSMPWLNSWQMPEQNKFASVHSVANNLKDVGIKSPYDISDPSIGRVPEGLNSKSDGYSTWTRYAPILGSAIGAGRSLFKKPDFSEIDNLKKSIANTPEISYTPLGNYISPNLIDPNLQANTLKQMGNRNNDTLLNTSGGNRAQASASLLASGYNNQTNLGQTLIGIGDNNHQRRIQAEEFNRGTDMANQQMEQRAQMANAQNRQYGIRNLMALEEMKQNMKDKHDMTVSTNITNLFDNIGNIGRENFAFNQVNASSPYYGINRDGSIFYKPAYYKLDKDSKKGILEEIKNLRSV